MHLSAALSLMRFRALMLGLLLVAGFSRAPAAPTSASLDGTSTRQYAPDRRIIVQHVSIDVTPDFKARTIQGRATVRFRVNSLPVPELRLDGVKLRVKTVTASEPVAAWNVTDDQVAVSFVRELPPGTEGEVRVEYTAEPAQGLYFRTPEMGYKDGEAHLFTQGEETSHRYWYPSLDAPNQMHTTEVVCRVPEGMTVISNGRLVSETKDPQTGLVAFHWSQEKPHANYLVTLVAGDFKKIEDDYHGIPLTFYTLPSEIDQAPNSFRGTKDMMAFFEEETGVPYPWPKYAQVCVNDFVAGGMENTSATTLTDTTLFSAASENIHSSEGLVAHELAHQWFGDLVTCKDWSHIWLNEGFATYYESLYAGHAHGRDEMLYDLWQRSASLTGNTRETTPIFRRDFRDPGDMFDHLAYGKASWVLHMLRCQLGPDLYRKAIKTYLERHRHGNVVTDDLREILEEVSGLALDQFFDQWIYHGGYPELQVSYQWDQQLKQAKIIIRQTHTVTNTVLLFDLPATLRFKGKFGSQDRSVRINRVSEDFTFPLDSAPEIVRFDPELTVLARVRFTPPRPMLLAQVNDNSDVLGRLIAIDELSGSPDKEVLSALNRSLNEDAFYGVRAKAAQALRSVHNEQALQILLESLKQPDARVRLRVVDAIGSFYDNRVLAALRGVIAAEKNPAIIGAALDGLSRYPREEVGTTLLEYLNSTSYHNELADDAIRAIRTQDDPWFIGLLRETLARREPEFMSRTMASGLQTLAWLSRHAEKKEQEREFLLKYLKHEKRRLREAAIRALGTLGDPKAAGPLETFASAARSNPERRAAESALAQLRAEKPAAEAPRGDLRGDVLDLQKANQELRKELESLKARLDETKPLPKPGISPESPDRGAPKLPPHDKGKAERRDKGTVRQLQSPKAGAASAR